jgi:hypothetical protein
VDFFLEKGGIRKTHPNFFLVPTGSATPPATRNRQPQVDATSAITTHECGILSLRIHARRLGAHAQTRRDERVGVERGMCLFDRFEEGELV